MPEALDVDLTDFRRAAEEMNGRAVRIDRVAAGARPRIWREMESAAEINRILNHPSVFPWVALPGQDKFDVSRIVVDPRVVFLRCEGGVMVLAPDGEAASGMWEAHTSFLDGYRGKEALDCAREMMAWMFCHTGAMMLWTRVPVHNQAALAMIRAVGASLWFTKSKSFPTDKGPVDVRFYALPIHDWIRKAKGLVEAGKWFHRRIEEEFGRLGHANGHASRWRDDHDDDDHDRFAGACVEMIRGGQPAKGIILYNRWARVAGYREVSLISTDPVVIETDGVLIHVKGDDFKVVRITEN